MFHAPTERWFERAFGKPTRVQSLGWPAVSRGEHVLMLAPTGSGKTLAAFLYSLDRIMFDPAPARHDRCRILYVSPLKALAADVERNLHRPLDGVAAMAESLGSTYRRPTVAVRTGDTPTAERASFARNPADILITTPESLYLLLTSRAREALRSVQTVILDEIHAMIGTKRGSHLALSLERLQRLTPGGFQRIGLSATVRPLDEAARFLGGGEVHDGWTPRPVTIIDGGSRRQLKISIQAPADDMTATTPGREDSGPTDKSIWPSIHPKILEQIRQHRTTIIFVNSRRLAERLAAALNELAGEDLVRAHHGSVSREQRLIIEERLKAGTLPAIAATSTLELGIDMGSVDLVIQVETPPGVASGLQRVGRAGHQVEGTSEGIFYPKFRGDLLACAAIVPEMIAGHVEALRYPRNPLDVLAQQIVAMACIDSWNVDGLWHTIRGAAPYADLSFPMFESVLDMLAGRYPSDDFSGLRPRIVWDRNRQTVRAREGARHVAIANAGTIPDRGLFGAFLAGSSGPSSRVGELDEEMVFESRVGDTFVLGATTWRIDEITSQKVFVSPAPGQPGRLPFWKGDGAGRPVELGRAIGALTRELRQLSRPEAVHQLRQKHHMDERAANHLMDYIRDQEKATGCVPDDRHLVVERYSDELGDWRVCLLSPFGARVHAPWAQAIRRRIRETRQMDAEILWTDDGIVVRLSESDEPPDVALLFPDSNEVTDLVTAELGGSPAFAGRFREAAARALLLPRRYVGQRSPLWQQRKRAADLLAVASRYPDFPVILESYRELLRDVFDLPALVDVLRRVEQRSIRLLKVDTTTASPFAASLMFGYVGTFMYSGDAPLAERRAQALTVDQSQLRELLGEADLRQILDPGVLSDTELELQRLAEPERVRTADDVHDLLLYLGDLSTAELRARCSRSVKLPSLLDQLKRDHRIAAVKIAATLRWIAAEDAGRYQSVTGAAVPTDLPRAFREPPDRPLRDLLSRYARTHGPFAPEEIAERLGIEVSEVQRELRELAADGRVIEGTFRPEGSGREWSDANVLRRLRQRTLTRLRHEVEPVEPAAYARFLLDWQGLGPARSGPQPLLRVIQQLQGLPIPASVLETQVLPARIEGYNPTDLDNLIGSGVVTWAGVQALGKADGRIVLYLTESAMFFEPPPGTERPLGERHDRLRAFLGQAGASFFTHILRGTGSGFKRELIEALWDLVWSGEVTNDSLAPLRSRTFPEEHRHLSRRGVPSAVPEEAAGRWSLISPSLAPAPSEIERRMAAAHQLLERHGVVTREALNGERIPGGFAAVYPVLKAMEEAGQVRRGYFVSGRGAAQFADAAAVERLRAMRSTPATPQVLILAATDPANPYGASLPWPIRKDRRTVGRFAGSQVILVDGTLTAYVSRGEHAVLTFFDDSDPGLSRLASSTAAALTGFHLERVDGGNPGGSVLAEALRAAGFRASHRGWLHPGAVTGR